MFLVFYGEDEMVGESTLSNVGEQDLLANRAYRVIRGAIFAGSMVSGAPLSVPKLASELGISRSPVREAVQRLVYEGLAVSTSHRGAMVAQVSSEDLQHLYEVREVLEGLATRSATERLDESVQIELEILVDQHRRALDQTKGVATHIELDMAFHKQIRELANNSHLALYLESLQGRIQLAMSALWRSDEASRRAVEEHERILTAMIDRDPLKAEQVARAHIGRVRRDLKDRDCRTGEEE